MNRPFRLSLRKPASNNHGIIRPEGLPPPPVVQPTQAPAAPSPTTQQQSSRPAPPSPLERVLSKAAQKARLAHPAAEVAKPVPPPSPAASGSGRQPSAVAPNKQPQQGKKQQQQQRKPQSSPSSPSNKSKGQAPVKSGKGAAGRADEWLDDDQLFAGITEEERDDVWESLKLEVEGEEADDLWDDDDASSSSGPSLARRRAAPASARDEGPSSSGSSSSGSGSSSSSASDAVPVASSSGFKGFGRPPAARSSSAAGAAAPSTSGTAAAAVTAASPQAGASGRKAISSVDGTGPRGLVPPAPSSPSSSSSSGGRLRVFLFNAEEAKTRTLLQETGLAGRVEVVGDLRSSDAILAAKLAKNGKHVNLTQAEKTAANAGIPFVVVGRNMSAENLRTALTALLEPGSEAAAAVAARAAAARVPSAAELQAARADLMRGLSGLAAGGGSGSGAQQ